MKRFLLGLCLFLVVGSFWELDASDEGDLEKLKATKVCVNCDLSKVNLTGASLNQAALTETNLTEANLTGAKLTGAYLTGASLTGASLAGANLYGAKVRGAILCSTTMPDGAINNSGC